MMITSKGQVTIPKEFRDLCGLHPHTEVEFALIDGRVAIQPMGQKMNRGALLIEHLRGMGDVGGLSTDEIMAMTRGED